jgi:hypothetical protein
MGNGMGNSVQKRKMEKLNVRYPRQPPPAPGQFSAAEYALERNEGVERNEGIVTAPDDDGATRTKIRDHASRSSLRYSIRPTSRLSFNAVFTAGQVFSQRSSVFHE